MRKLIAFIALLLLPYLLLSCFDRAGECEISSEDSSDNTIVEIPATTVEGKLNSDKTLPLLDSLSEYLTNEGYTGTTEEALNSIISQYSYQGTLISKLVDAAVYDGTDNSGGTHASHQYFGYHWHYSYPEDGKSVHYNNFYTRVPLDGLILPFGITFNDTFYDVLKKLGLEFNPGNEGINTEAALLTSGESALVFYYDSYVDYTVHVEYSLRFTDIYYWKRWDGAKFPYKRELTLNFDDSGKLCRVWMQISSS